MPDLKAQFFEGSQDLPADLRNALSILPSGLGMRDTLTALGWKGEAIATVCLTLTVDGSRAAHGSFGLWGSLSPDTIEVPTNKIWEGTPRGTTICIRDLQGQQFRFSGGNLQSEYMDTDNFDISFTRNGQVIQAND